jgi:hypothetical protein
MAENNIPISPLDPLGPSYGKINPPSIDAIGLSAFEGEKLSMKPINFPAPTRISVPGNQSVQRPNSDIRQNIVGSPPNPTGSRNPNAFRGKSSEDIGQTFVDYAKAISQSNQDKNEYARIYSYDAGPDSGAFYKRYAAYGQEKFDAVGFHPFRDNEAIFNAKTTGWNDFSRMMTHAAVPLFTRGFMSGPKSLWKAMQGDFSGDTEDAKIYAEAAAIGQSSKGGLGSFLNNAAMNFSYSAGIITEALIEEGVGLLLAAPTGGASLVATTANVGKNLFRLGKGIDTAMDLSRATTSTLKSLDNISNARSFWSAAKSEKALKSPLGRFINPVENLTESMYSIAKNEKNLTGLARTYDAGFKTVGGFYKDVRSLNMALSEARLEAGMQQNDMYKELYNEHYLTTGTAPTDEQQQLLLQTAKEAGTTTLGWNSALIYFSNKLVIPNIVGPRGGIANFLKSKTEDIINLENGFIRKSAKETVLKSGKKVYTPEFSYVKKGFKNTLTSFYKDPLSKSIKGGLTYFKGNISEGIQENLQEVISEATKNYYVDKYKNPTKVNALSTFDYAKRLTTDALKNQFSAQGFETFASGFVMGMFAAPLNGVPAVASLGYNKIFNKEGYAEYKAVRDNYGNNLAKNLNSISIPEFFDSNIMNYTTQLEADDLGKNGTEKEAKDSANAAIIDQLKPMLKHGTVNEFKDYLTSFKNLTPEEFEEVVNAEPGTGAKYLGKIDEVIGKVNRIQKRYDYWTEKFPNPISQQQLESLKGTPDYETAQYLGTAWNMGIENAIYFNESFEDTSSRMTSIINDVVSNSPLQKASATDIKVLFDQDLLDNEIGILDSEVKSLKESELPESKKSLNKKSVKLEAMKKLKVLTQGYKDFIANRKNIVEELTSKGIAKEDINDAILEANNDFLLDLEENFNAYFKSIAEVNDEFLFDDSIDNAFIKYVDFHLLENERNAMVKSINLLNDPQGFIEHVQRNQAWMKDLYENKAEYYEDMKNKAFELIEGNALLNELANKGIYISLDDYQKWKDDRVLPDEFYDDINKVVIRPGNPQYDSLAGLFQMINFRDESGAYDPIVKQKLQELDNQLEAEIDKLPKQETKKDLGEISKGKSKFISIEKINENLSDTEYVEATYLGDTEGEDTTLIFYKDGDVLRSNNKDGEEIDVKNFKSLSASKGQFVSAQKFQLVLAPDPIEVDKITKEYQARKEEVINDYIASGQQTPIESEKKPLSTESTLEEISAESVNLYNELVFAFEDYAEKAGMTDLAVDDYEEALASFIKTNIVASEIINNYKKEKELATGTETNESNRIPMLSLGDRQIKLSDLSEQELRNYLRTFDSGLKVLEEKENPTPEELEKIRNYKYSIRIIEDFLSKSKKEQYTPEQQKTLDKVQKVIDAQDELLKTKGGYVINGKVLARVTNIIKQFDTEEYKYSAEDAVIASYRTTIEKDGLNISSINDFVEQLRKQSLPGFSGFTYDELTRELNDVLQSSGTKSGKSEIVSEIFQPSAPIIKKEGDIIFGAAGKMGSFPNRINQDAIFVDQQKGLFILADGMGGVNKIPFFQPHHAAKLMIDHFRGIQGKNPVNIIYDLYKTNNNVSVEEVFEKLKEEGYIDKESKLNSIGDVREIAIRIYLNIFKGVHKGEENWLSNAVGAVGVKAQRIGKDKYEIEHVGDAVFFIVDKNNKIKRAEGLSTSPFVDGFIWGLDTNNQVGIKPAKTINKYQIELKPGEKLILSSDFIETKEAIQDFINSNFGENLNFDSFRKNHKNDDASFIVIPYGASVPFLKTTPTEPVLDKKLEDVIMATVLEKTYEASRIAGNYLDDQLRNIFDNKPAVYNEAQISRDAYDNLFNTDPDNLGYVTQIKNIIDEKGMVVISRITPTNADERGLVVFDEDAGVAGEIDLLVIDKLGKLLILDVKTGKSTKWKGFEKEGNIASKKANYTLQQATYANLLYNLTGEQASIAILPIEIDYEQETGKIIKGKGRPTAPGLIADNDFKINLDITPDIQEKIDSVIPRKVFEVPVVEKPVSSEDGQESPYEEFIDSNLPDSPESFGVDPKLLEAINNATQEQLDNVKRVLVEKLGVYDVSEVTELQEAIDKRQRELTSSPESIKYNSSNTASGSTFIAENTTFTGKNNDKLFADTGDTVTVVKTNSADNTLVIKNIDNIQKTISFEELNKMFKLKEQVMNFETAATEQGPLSKEEKDFVSESSDNVKELLSKTEAKNILKKEAANQSLDQVDDELFNDTTSNC